MPTDAARAALLAHGKKLAALTVVGATGHQAIPGRAIPYIEAHLRAALQDVGRDLVGVCSLAVGADQMFALNVLEVGGQLQVVVPSSGYETTFDDERIRTRYRQLLRRASRTDTLDFPEPTEEAFFAAGRRIVEECETLLAVWDGQASQGLGGTGDVVEYARKLGRPVEIIWPAGIAR